MQWREAGLHTIVQESEIGQKKNKIKYYCNANLTVQPNKHILLIYFVVLTLDVFVSLTGDAN